MSTRHLLRATAASAAVLAATSIGIAAEQRPIQVMEHHTTIIHIVEAAQTAAEHEVELPRFGGQVSVLVL